MKIYHGSKLIIEKPIYRGSEPTNDYGPAFYLTLDLESAKSWACRNDNVGLVNEYDIRKSVFDSFKILDLTKKDTYSVLNWIAILMHFRKLDSTFRRNNEIAIKWLEKYYIDITDYDVVIGFRADDAYFRFPTRFLSNDLALEDLEEAFKLGSLGVQYSFISKKAIDSLKFSKAIKCDKSFLGHCYLKVKKASQQFDEMLNKPRDPNKTYILDLLRRDNE